jgi:hypothetical protein
MHRLEIEDLSAEADTREYDDDGNIRIIGTNVTVPARPATNRPAPGIRPGSTSTRAPRKLPTGNFTFAS